MQVNTRVRVKAGYDSDGGRVGTIAAILNARDLYPTDPRYSNNPRIAQVCLDNPDGTTGRRNHNIPIEKLEAVN